MQTRGRSSERFLRKIVIFASVNLASASGPFFSFRTSPLSSQTFPSPDIFPPFCVRGLNLEQRKEERRGQKKPLWQRNEPGLRARLSPPPTWRRGSSSSSSSLLSHRQTLLWASLGHFLPPLTGWCSTTRRRSLHAASLFFSSPPSLALALHGSSRSPGSGQGDHGPNSDTTQPRTGK